MATVMETCAQYMTVRQKGQTFVFRTALELMFFPEEDTLEEENKMISSLDRIGILWELVQKHSEIQDDLPKDSLSSLIPLCQRPAKIHPVPLVTPGDVVSLQNLSFLLANHMNSWKRLSLHRMIPIIDC